MAVDQRPPYANIPETPPDVQAKGRAWKMVETDPQVALWLVDTKGFGNDQWWWYVVVCNHLRLTDKDEHIDPAAWIEQVGTNTHEMVIGVWQQDVPLPPIYGPGKLSLLAPVEFVDYVQLKSDKHAEWVTEGLVKSICNGESPDQENRSLITRELLAWVTQSFDIESASSTT